MKPQHITPGPGQELVWDYPRPPRVEDSTRRIRVVLNGQVVADTHRAKRVLETSQAPAYYIPPEDVNQEYLQPSDLLTWCEWKGQAAYYTVVVGDRKARNAAWSYPEPNRRYAEIKGYIAFYPQHMEACYVDDERVQTPPGNFYGGWITGDIVGPFKGAPGTEGW